MNIIPGPDTKRRKSGTETPTIARDILPKPSNGSPMSMTTSSPATVSQKKRGRPSKADVERKQREAIERGDIIPPAPVAAPPAGQQGQEEVRSGNFAPIMIAPAPAPARSPPAPITPAHVLSPQLGLEQGPTQPPVTMSGDPSGKKRKPRQPPKPKVGSLFNLIGVMLIKRRCKSQVKANFRSIHNWPHREKGRTSLPQLQRRLRRLVPLLLL